MKRYICLGCGLKQKVKGELVTKTVIYEGDRSINGIFARCAKCKKTVRMISASKEE